MSGWDVVADPNVEIARKAAAEAVAARKHVDEQIATLRELAERTGQTLLAFKAVADGLQAIVQELQRPRTLKVTKRHRDGAIMEAEMRAS